MLRVRCLTATLMVLALHAVAAAQSVQSLEIIINRFELFSTGGGTGVITFSSMNSGSMNGQPWPHIPFGIHIAPLTILGPAPTPMIPPVGPVTIPYFMNTTPIPGGLQLTDSSGGVASMTVYPNMGTTFGGPPSDPFYTDPGTSPDDPSGYGPHMFFIDGGLLLDSNGGPFDFSAFGWDAGGGLFSLMLTSTEIGADWNRTLLEGGKLSGTGLLTITGGRLPDNPGNQIPEPTTIVLWSLATVAGVVWTRRRIRLA